MWCGLMMIAVAHPISAIMRLRGRARIFQGVSTNSNTTVSSQPWGLWGTALATE